MYCLLVSHLSFSKLLHNRMRSVNHERIPDYHISKFLLADVITIKAGMNQIWDMFSLVFTRIMVNGRRSGDKILS